MKDIADQIAKLRADAEKCDALAKTGEPDMQVFYRQLADRIRFIADQMERTIERPEQGNPTRH